MPEQMGAANYQDSVIVLYCCGCNVDWEIALSVSHAVNDLPLHILSLHEYHG